MTIRPLSTQTPVQTRGEEEVSLVLSADYIVLGVGGTKQLTLQKDGQDVAAASVTWSASGAAATVAAGLVTGVAEGECTVTAAYEGEQATATVVRCAIRNMTVAESQIVLTTGGTAGDQRLRERMEGRSCRALAGGDHVHLGRPFRRHGG